MIERLINLERPYREPEYSKLSNQITLLRNMLEQQLNPEGLAGLKRLSDAYISQGDALLRDGFADGFWCAVKLILEFQGRKS